MVTSRDLYAESGQRAEQRFQRRVKHSIGKLSVQQAESRSNHIRRVASMLTTIGIVTADTQRLENGLGHAARKGNPVVQQSWIIRGNGNQRDPLKRAVFKQTRELLGNPEVGAQWEAPKERKLRLRFDGILDTLKCIVHGRSG